jgi:hypothetical protein
MQVAVLAEGRTLLKRLQILRSTRLITTLTGQLDPTIDRSRSGSTRLTRWAVRSDDSELAAAFGGANVVAVAARQRHRERDALAVGDHVVLAARPCAVDRAGSAFGLLRAARTWEESVTARDQSSRFCDRSSFSST